MQGDSKDEYPNELAYMLETKNDYLIRSLIDGFQTVGDVRTVLEWESRHQNRNWVIRKAERRMQEVRE